jgi:hypothetical protein
MRDEEKGIALSGSFDFMGIYLFTKWASHQKIHQPPHSFSYHTPGKSV